MNEALDVNEDSAWARYAEGTSGRDPMKFFETAVTVTNGQLGDGRLVVDLGSGAGNESLAFLERGWSVHAVDGEPRAIEILESRVDKAHQDRLTTTVGYFHEVEIPRGDLVFASLSLPFAGAKFEVSMEAALAAVNPGGWFVGVLLGQNDTWAPDADVTSVDRVVIARLFMNFDPVTILEEEFDGPSSIGPKHWHWFVISAQRPPMGVSS